MSSYEVDPYETNPFRYLEVSARKQGDERTKRKIARKMKASGMFSLEYIAELCELELKTVSRLKVDGKN